MTYQAVLTDMVDWIAWAQVDGGNGEGGWRYGFFDNASGDADNSVSQWPVLGLVAAEQWGISAPQYVKDELKLWVTYIQNVNGGSGYDSPLNLVNVAKTGGLLVEFHYLGDSENTARAQAALGYVNDHWGDLPSDWDGNKGHPYAMFAVFKGLELMKVLTIPNAPAHSPDTLAGDWYGDYADYLVNAQNPDGSWNGYLYWNNVLSTGWYIVILQATIFPVQVSVDVPDCTCDSQGYSVTVNYSVERFPADGTLTLLEDGVPVDIVLLTGFQGSGSYTLTVASDTPGSHEWKAVLAVIGGGISATVEGTDSVKVCETPKVAGIPDQITPFQTFDLDNYLSYSGGLPVSWSVSGVPAGWTVTIDAGNVVTVTAPAGATVPATLTFTASIECCAGVICTGSDDAVFTPNQPPDCSQAKPSIAILWPPNNQFVPVQVLGVTDPDGDPITITITGIKQDEPVNTVGDGNFTPDGKGVGTDTAQLRAERSGTAKVPGNGRVYHVYFTASDGRGGVCTGKVLVAVPHDIKKPAVDGGALFDSTAVSP
jgi:hypothetical protein